MIPTLQEDIRRDIGQHFVFGFHGFEMNETVKVLIKDFHVGNFILMKRNVRDAFQVRKLVWDLQQFAMECGHKRPLLIGIDQENGMVSAFSSPAAGTQFPGAMSMAATGSPELVEQINAAAGEELAGVGINWAFSPVADVNSDPLNPVIGVRSFGDDPATVGRFANAVLKGLNRASVAACAKHFPGHGDTRVDSHLALPVIPKSASDLEATELVPFKALMLPTTSSVPLPSIMIGHMALPLLTGTTTPASLNRSVTTDLLRQKLKYQGVVVTDCLEMDAVAALEGGSERAAVDSLKAGADIAMVCHTFARQAGAVRKTWAAYAAGELNTDELQTSRGRIGALKSIFLGGWGNVLPPENAGQVQEKYLFNAHWVSLTRQHKLLSQKVYSKSIWVMDEDFVLPVSAGDTILVCTPESETLNQAVDDAEDLLRSQEGLVRNTAGASFLSFFASVTRRALECTHIVYTKDNDPLPSLDNRLTSFSAIVFVFRNAQRSQWQVDNFMAFVSRAYGHNPTMKLVILSTCEPYDVSELAKGKWRVGGAAGMRVAYMASFEFTALALEAAAAVMFGEVDGEGMIPVQV